MEEAIVISPLDEQMEQALVKKNVTDAVINALKEKYGELRLRSIDDKEKYLEIKEAKKDCAKLRNLAVKVCKEGRADAVALQKKWVAKENEVVGKIEEVESPLDAEIDRFDAETKRKEDEEKQRQETQYMRRTQALTKMGALYSDNSFVLGEFSLEANLVKESSQEVWDDEILPKFNEQFFILEAERIEQEKVKAEKEAEMKRQQEELLKQQREFQEQQEAFKRQQQLDAEKKREEEIAKERAEKKRRDDLQSKRLGMIAPFNPHASNIDISNLWQFEDEEWETVLHKRKADFQVEETEKQKVIAEKAAQAERERIAEEQRQAEIKRQQEEAKRAEDLAKSGDKAIWYDFIYKLNQVEFPTVKSRQYKQMLVQAKEKIGEILDLKP